MKQLLAAACALALASLSHAQESVRYTALINGGKDRAGHLAVSRSGERYKVDYVFKDNGRGPELKEEYTLAADGTFARYSVQGVSTYGAPVEESFTRRSATARWKSKSDAGEQSVMGAALYSPLGGSPQAYSVMLGALAQRPDGKLPLIPSGTLTQRKLMETELTRAGSKLTVQLIAFTGVGFAPTTVWATAGPKPRLFAYIYPGYVQLIEAGWEASGSVLEQRQNDAEKELLVDFNRRLSHALPGRTLIRNTRVFDSETATLGASSDVLIESGRVIEVSPTGASARPADRIIDAGNRVLLPGLFDMHVHAGAWDGGLHIATGVTSARDMGNDNPTLLALMQQERDGTLMMPRLVGAGFIEGESANAARSGYVINNLAEAKQAVDWYHEHGFPQVKIYNSFPKEILVETTQYAHALGMRVSGHVPVWLRAEDAVLAGYDEIQHINQVLLNFLVDDKTDTRTLLRFQLPADKVGTLDFNATAVQQFIALLAQRKIVVDPTLATFDYLRQLDGTLSQAFAAVADHVPPDVRRSFFSAQMDIENEAAHQRYEKSYQGMVEFVGRLYRAGVPIVAGTDDLPGFALQRELELYVQAGITPAQVLQIATYNGARYTRTLDDRGVISPGRRADLILVDGEPTQNISDIRKVALVIKGEVAYQPSAVFEAMGVKPFTPAIALP